MSKILYSITRGYSLDSSDMSEQEKKAFIKRIESNDAILPCGKNLEEEGEVVHFEGDAWEQE